MYEPDRMKTDEYATIAEGTARRPLTSGLCAAVAICAFSLTFVAPVTIDLATGSIAVNSAFAGAGDGNYGNGKGNGGPNGQNPGNSGGNGGDSGGGDSGGGDSGGGDSGGGGDTGGGGSPTPGNLTDGTGSGSSTQDAANMADADYGDAVDAATGSTMEGPAATTTGAMPTVSEIFSMGDEAVVSRQTEQELIANGWNSVN